MTDPKKFVEENRKRFGICESRGFAEPEEFRKTEVPAWIFNRALDLISALLAENEGLLDQNMRLCRERDDLRATLVAVCEKACGPRAAPLKGIVEYVGGLVVERDEARRERDEARREWENRGKALHLLECGKYGRNYYAAQCEQLRREMDEARSSLACVSEIIAKERRIRNMNTAGGQSTGESPTMSVSTLRELERVFAHAGDEYVVGNWSKMEAELAELRKRFAETDDSLSRALDACDEHCAELAELRRVKAAAEAFVGAQVQLEANRPNFTDNELARVVVRFSELRETLAGRGPVQEVSHTVTHARPDYSKFRVTDAELQAAQDSIDPGPGEPHYEVDKFGRKKLVDSGPGEKGGEG